MRFADVLATETPSPSNEAVNKEFQNNIAIGMEKLSPRHREILTLRNVLNKSYEEIADILGISVGTVKSRIARARESLRATLPDDFSEVTQKKEFKKSVEKTESRITLKEMREKKQKRKETIRARIAQKYPQFFENESEKSTKTNEPAKQFTDKEIREKLVAMYPQLGSNKPETPEA